MDSDSKICHIHGTIDCCGIFYHTTDGEHKGEGKFPDIADDLKIIGMYGYLFCIGSGPDHEPCLPTPIYNCREEISKLNLPVKLP